MDTLPPWVITLVLRWLKQVLTPELLEALKQHIVCWFKAQAASTETKVDDAIVAIVAQALGADPSKCPS